MSQFLSENSNSLIVETSIKFWSKIYNILGYMKKSIFSKFGAYFRWKMLKTVDGNFLKKNRKNPILWGKSMLYNVVFLCIKDFDKISFLKLWTIKKIICTIKNIKKQSIRNFLKKNRKNPIFWGKSMSYNVVLLYIMDFL